MKHVSNHGKEQLLFGNDSIVIQKFVSGIVGGRTLDLSEWKDSTVPAGCVIVKKGENYMPMPVVALTETVGEEQTPVVDADGNQKYGYASLPEGATYAGMLYRTILKSDAQASIMIDGVVNEECLPYDISAIKSAFLAAVPHIIFVKDEIA